MVQATAGGRVHLRHGVGQDRVPGEHGAAGSVVKADAVQGMSGGVEHLQVKPAEVQGSRPP